MQRRVNWAVTLNMAWRVCLQRLTLSDLLSSSSHGKRFTLYTQPRRGFRKAPKKTEVKKGEVEDVGFKQADPSEGAAQRKGYSSQADPSTVHIPHRSFGRLVKPLVFTVGFTGCSFGAAAIWQYETLKSRVQSYFDEVQADWLDKLRPQKQGDIRKQVNQWWNRLTEGQRTVTGIIALNALVFCCWRVPALKRTMLTYFTSNPASKALCFPMILSTFSHYSFFHMATNMYVLWSFSSSIVSLLGPQQFMAVYMSAGVISTFMSYVCKTATGRLGPSLGASGAIMTVLAAVCTKMPEAKLAIVFLPMFTFTAGNALSVILSMDLVGLVLGWRFFDHAAHLGGALFGIWYVTYGHDLIWKNREPIVKIWHDLRTKGPGGGGSGSGSF
ncbi:hypothetical protein JZ751_001980 [Albula glossodonta]|uniref:rhomboid protease n=1 Tax=Albula glossodonta TaxID=121402 RepID=A0A8T2P6Q7_9TELE|nr:hypothetical protein JZ751_001980 [Albula glossodonta]